MADLTKGLFTLRKKDNDKGFINYRNSESRDITYYFDIIKSHTVQLQSQITDYWLENNTAVQDTINHSPIIITLSGLIGEIVYKPPHTVTDWISNKLNKLFPQNNGVNLTDKLSKIASIVPKVDNYTQLAKNAISYVENTYKKVEKVINLFNKSNQNLITKQEKIYLQLFAYWKNNVELIVTTPYDTFENMYIQNVTFNQGETNTVSEITVTLKQLNFAEIRFTKADPKVLSKINSMSQAQTTNLGQAPTKRTKLAEILNYNGEGAYRQASSK